MMTLIDRNNRGRVVRAFTLVEILIVVAILGILALAVLATFGQSTAEAAQTTFVTNLRHYAEAAMLYRERTGEYPGDGSSGEVPAGFEDYVDEAAFERPTPIGGVWDIEFNELGIISAVGVHFDGTGQTHDDDFMNEVDAIFDDGDVATGVFRRIAADRYYWVIAD